MAENGDNSDHPDGDHPDGDHTVGDQATGASRPELVSPDYLERKSNRNSWLIVGIFTAIIVLLFVFMGIALVTS